MSYLFFASFMIKFVLLFAILFDPGVGVYRMSSATMPTMKSEYAAFIFA
jgi:hypothetical protein